jgi:flagellar motor switch protein FliM
VSTESIAVESPDLGTQPEPRAVESFNFQNPGHSIREGIKRLESAHEAFAGRFERALSDSYGATIELELQGIQQSTFTRYLASLPLPGVLGALRLQPFPGNVILELSAEAGLPLIELILGGTAEVFEERKLTLLERQLLEAVAGDAVGALGAALEPLGLEVVVEAWESDAQFLDLPAGELAILVKYGLRIGESPLIDRLVLIYPLSALQSIAEGNYDAAEPGVRDHLPAVTVPFHAHLQDSQIAYRDLAALRPGDVLRLDHSIDAPVIGFVGSRPLVAGRLGTTRNKLALEIAGWIDS